MSDDAVFPIGISAPLTVNYDPTTGELIVRFVQLHPARDGGIPMALCFEPPATKELLSAIRQLETAMGGSIEVPGSKNYVQ